jgi:hypothetical protein
MPLVDVRAGTIALSIARNPPARHRPPPKIQTDPLSGCDKPLTRLRRLSTFAELFRMERPVVAQKLIVSWALEGGRA